MNNEFAEKLIETKLKYQLYQALDANYKLEQEEKGKMTLHIKSNPENGLNINRVEITADGVDFHKLVNFMSVMINRSVVDSDFTGNVLAKIDEHTTLYYCKVKAPVMLMDARDFVVLSRVEKISDDEYLVINKSIEHPNHPPIKGVQRAEILVQCGHYKKTSPTQVHIIQISHIDMKGDIPKAMLVKSGVKGAEVLQKMVEYVKKH